MQSIVMLSIILLSIVMLSIIMLIILMLSVVMLSVIMLSVIILSVIMLSVVMLSVVILSVVTLSVALLSVVAPDRDIFYKKKIQLLTTPRGICYNHDVTYGYDKIQLVARSIFFFFCKVHFGEAGLISWSFF
jgi:hypothetical protein